MAALSPSQMIPVNPCSEAWDMRLCMVHHEHRSLQPSSKHGALCEARAYLQPVQLWDVGRPNQHGVGHDLELHLNAHLRVAHHQLGIVVLGLDGQQLLQGGWPAQGADELQGLALCSIGKRSHIYARLLDITSLLTTCTVIKACASARHRTAYAAAEQVPRSASSLWASGQWMQPHMHLQSTFVPHHLN